MDYINENTDNEDMKSLIVIKQFNDRLLEGMQDIEPEFAAIIHEEFWNLI